MEDLKALDEDIRKLKEAYPEACEKIVELIKKRRRLGYRNFCKSFTGEWKPERLKSEGGKEG